MNNKIQERFNALLSHKAVEAEAPPLLTEALARQLLDRLGQLRLFAHAYPLLTNLTHGRVTPGDLLDFAYRHELQGLSLHLLDGEENSLSQMTPTQLQAFADKANALGLDVHLEISSTLKKDVDQVIAIAKALGTRNIRVYSRYEGALSRVMDVIESDLHYLAQQADEHDLFFDFEQHEELKSGDRATAEPPESPSPARPVRLRQHDQCLRTAPCGTARPGPAHTPDPPQGCAHRT